MRVVMCGRACGPLAAADHLAVVELEERELRDPEAMQLFWDRQQLTPLELRRHPQPQPPERFTRVVLALGCAEQHLHTAGVERGDRERSPG